MATRNAVNFWLDAVSLLLMLGLTLTGGLMYYVLPPGTGHSHAIVGLGRHDLGRIHFYLAAGTLLAIVAHVWLHWRWVCCVAVRRTESRELPRRARMIWGLAVLGVVVVGLGGSLLWASAGIERTGGEARMHEGGHGHRELAAVPAPAVLASSPEPVQRLGEALTAETLHDTQPSGRPTPALALAKHAEDCPAGAALNGRSSLSEAAVSCRLSVERLQQALKLPPTVNPHERLGRLKRWYGISIHDVRRLACR